MRSSSLDFQKSTFHSFFFRMFYVLQNWLSIFIRPFSDYHFTVFKWVNISEIIFFEKFKKILMKLPKIKEKQRGKLKFTKSHLTNIYYYMNNSTNQNKIFTPDLCKK